MDKPGIPIPVFLFGRHTRQIDPRTPNYVLSKLYAYHMESCCISMFDSIHGQLRRVVNTAKDIV
jgi:hypothetical protein